MARKNGYVGLFDVENAEISNLSSTTFYRMIEIHWDSNIATDRVNIVITDGAAESFEYTGIKGNVFQFVVLPEFEDYTWDIEITAYDNTGLAGNVLSTSIGRCLTLAESDGSLNDPNRNIPPDPVNVQIISIT